MTNSTPTPTSKVQSTPINQVLSQTDVPSLISKYKVQIILGIVALLAILIGVGSYLHYQGEKTKEYASIVFQFEENSLKNFKDGKMNPEDFIKSLSELQKKVTFFTGAVPVLITSADLLASKSMKAEAISLLSALRLNISRDAFFQRYFLLARLGALYEDQGEMQAAVSVLEELQGLPYKIYEARVYLDLGRLYLKVNNAEKAKSSFQYVIDNGNDPDLAQVARLYLANIK
ncbi:MAG: hypothetical protein A2X86_11260 [Bdellovibrionales bacterium GWA2_49_15]|nr:MAG: hypothetical protein A2X86_11260 [Bdellovibrionales bacterium GWA2_49_15]